MELIRWENDVADHDYEAAESYLSLRLEPKEALGLVRRMRNAKVVERRANDLLRSADRPPLPLTDPGVHRDLLKVLNRQKLSPVLVLSYEVGCDIADGYHRVSLAWQLTPFSSVPLKIVQRQG